MARFAQTQFFMLLHAIVKGRVQGVGFRYFVLHRAQGLGLNGWVKNLPDGSVELEAEGDEANLRRLEDMLWRGPMMSSVDEVDAFYSEARRDFHFFDVEP